MAGMSVSDWVLLGIGGYVAVVSLVRLMRSRRDELVDELSQEVAEEQRRKHKAERMAKKATAKSAKATSKAA